MGRGKSPSATSSLTAGFAAAGIITRAGKAPEETRDARPGPEEGDAHMKRYAMFGYTGAREKAVREIENYLPGNYQVIGTGTDEETGLGVVVIGGRDSSGWSLGSYVLPRLASGLHHGKEIGLDHPVMKQIPVR